MSNIEKSHHDQIIMRVKLLTTFSTSMVVFNSVLMAVFIADFALIAVLVDIFFMRNEQVFILFVSTAELTQPVLLRVSAVVCSCTGVFEQPLTTITPFSFMARRIAAVLYQITFSRKGSAARNTLKIARLFGSAGRVTRHYRCCTVPYLVACTDSGGQSLAHL